MMSLLRSQRRNTLKTILIWACLMIPASAFLYSTNNTARAVENEMNLTKRLMSEEKEALRVLRAEWAYLNNPQRLAAQTKQHFSGVKAMAASQVVPMKTLTTKVAMRVDAPGTEIFDNGMMRIAGPATHASPLLAKSIVYDQSLLAALHREEPTKIPSAASWTQKMVSALGLGSSSSKARTTP
jgi:hypothetical protein